RGGIQLEPVEDRGGELQVRAGVILGPDSKGVVAELRAGGDGRWSRRVLVEVIEAGAQRQRQRSAGQLSNGARAAQVHHLQRIRVLDLGERRPQRRAVRAA